VNVSASFIKLLFRNRQDKEFYLFVKHCLGFTPRNIYYYKKALTHKSALVKTEEGVVLCNERLEFLGDSILDSIIADHLFTIYHGKDEGFLTQMRSKIVNRKALNEIAINLRINKYIKANNLNIDHNNAMGNAFEALVGAIYLDKGYPFTKRFIVDKILNKYYDFNYLERVDTNFKSKLIELAQKYKKTIEFDSVENPLDGKGNPIFTATIIIDNKVFCSAIGHTKKDAEQNAAKVGLQKNNL